MPSHNRGHRAGEGGRGLGSKGTAEEKDGETAGKTQVLPDRAMEHPARSWLLGA